MSPRAKRIPEKLLPLRMHLQRRVFFVPLCPCDGFAPSCCNSLLSRPPGTHSRFHWNLPFCLRGVAIYCCRGHQEPTLGSTGTDRFDQHSHRFADFYLPPRALFIILNKARGAPRSDPPSRILRGGGLLALPPCPHRRGCRQPALLIAPISKQTRNCHKMLICLWSP